VTPLAPARPGRATGRSSSRVLIIVQNMPVPLDRRVWQECRTLIDAGYGVSVICPRAAGQGRHELVDSVHLHTYAPPATATGPAGFVLEFLYCWVRTLLLSVRVLVGEGFDVIQACNPPDTYFALGLLYRPFGKRFIYDQHDLCPEVYVSRFQRRGGLLLRGLRALERMTYRTAHHVISPNESYRDVALRRGGVDPRSVTVVRSGPDPETMRRGKVHPELRHGKPFLCCWLGIMGPQDGVDLLLESIRSLVHDEGRHDTHFALLGYGDCLDDLQASCTRLGLDPWVTFTGRAELPTIEAYLSTADIGLSADPSSPLNDVSTMNKTMEYMAYCLPVIAYDLPETRVSAGAAAVYVTPNDQVAYAKAISDLLDSPAQRADMGGLGRARIEGILSWQRQAPGYVRAIGEVLDGEPSERSFESAPEHDARTKAGIR
jgi:glycosyltransferase involved in cell wall biosynthesis